MRLTWILAFVLFVLGAGDGVARAHILGFNTHGWQLGADVTRDLGMHAVRDGCCEWQKVLPTPDAWDWHATDPNNDCNATIDGGHEMMGSVGSPPAWARDGNVPQLDALKVWVWAEVIKCSGRIKYWQLLNEPNYVASFPGTRDEYVNRVLIPAADIIHAWCNDCKVVAPGLADTSDHDGSPYDWLDYILLHAGDKIDVVDVHVYEPAGGVQAYLDRIHGIMVARGAGAKELWVTEADLWGGVQLCSTARMEAQRQYYQNLFALAATRPWWTRTYIYEAFTYDAPIPCGSPDLHAGIVVPGVLDEHGNYRINTSGDPYNVKLAYHFLQQLVAQDPVFGGDGVGGSVVNAPAPYYGAAFVSDTVPGTVGPNQLYRAKVTVRNTGSYTWYGKLNYRLVQGGMWPVYPLPAGARVAPGETYTFDVMVAGTVGTGTRTESFQMVKDGRIVGGPADRILVGAPLLRTVTTAAAAPVPTQIRFRELDTSCGTPAPTFTAWLNGTQLAAPYVQRASQDCTCTPAVRTAAVTTAIAGHTPDAPDMFAAWRGASPYTAWMKAVTLWSDGSETSDCIYDVNGGNCDVTNLCTAGYSALTQYNYKLATPVGRGLPAAQSCAGNCGGSGGTCWCDSLCAQYGDCCADKADVCD